MHRALPGVLALSVAACAGGAEPPAPLRAREASAATIAPATRLVLPGTRRPDLDCADFPDQASAQAALRADAADPHGLDHDRDGIACEQLGPPRDGDPVAR